MGNVRNKASEKTTAGYNNKGKKGERGGCTLEPRTPGLGGSVVPTPQRCAAPGPN